MSSPVRAPYTYLGKNGDYPAKMNFGIRIYDNKGKLIPGVGELKSTLTGELKATLKGGLRVNFIGEVPLLDGEKPGKRIGTAEVIQIISAKPVNMQIEHINDCGFKTLQQAIDYVSTEHKEDFERDGVMTIYYFKVVSLN